MSDFVKMGLFSMMLHSTPQGRQYLNQQAEIEKFNVRWQVIGLSQEQIQNLMDAATIKAESAGVFLGWLEDIDRKLYSGLGYGEVMAKLGQLQLTNGEPQQPKKRLPETFEELAALSDELYRLATEERTIEHKPPTKDKE